jgi:transposase
MLIMMGQRQQRQESLFYTGFSLEERIGRDNRLRRIAEVVDFSFVRPAVAHLYGDVGHPSIDPVVVLKLMLICFLEKIPSERELIRRLPERLDWLWFCEFDLDSTLPNHSVSSKARRRWGVTIFEKFFARILGQCMEAGLVDGETIHLDSSLIQGDVSVDSLQPAFAVLARQTFDQLESHCDVPVEAPPVASAPVEAGTKLSDTDPEARCRTKGKQSVIGYQEHRAVDDAYGIITASETLDASVHEGRTLPTLVEQHERNTGGKATHVVADKAYGEASNYEYLHEHEQWPCIPHKHHSATNTKAYPKSKFTYDEKSDCYVCPCGVVLKRQSQQPNARGQVIYRAPRNVCHACPQCQACFGEKIAQQGKSLCRSVGEEHIQWADHCLTKGQRRRLLKRRKCVIEGSFGDASRQHGLKRARWRGRWKVKIQNLMIAALQNLRKLLKYGHPTNRSAAMLQNATIWAQWASMIAFARAQWVVRNHFPSLETPFC